MKNRIELGMTPVKTKWFGVSWVAVGMITPASVLDTDQTKPTIIVDGRVKMFDVTIPSYFDDLSAPLQLPSGQRGNVGKYASWCHHVPQWRCRAEHFSLNCRWTRVKWCIHMSHHGSKHCSSPSTRNSYPGLIAKDDSFGKGPEARAGANAWIINYHKFG